MRIARRIRRGRRPFGRRQYAAFQVFCWLYLAAWLAALVGLHLWAGSTTARVLGVGLLILLMPDLGGLKQSYADYLSWHRRHADRGVERRLDAGGSD